MTNLDYQINDPIRELSLIYTSDKYLDRVIYVENDITTMHMSLNPYTNGTDTYFSWDFILYGSKCKKDNGSIMINRPTLLNATQTLYELNYTKDIKTEHYSYETALDRDEKEQTYTVALSNDKLEFQVDISGKYNAIKKTIPELGTILTIKLSDDLWTIKHYLFNNGTYYIVNLLDHTETFYINGNTIEFKFEDTQLSNNEYLIYHNPVRATFYEANKEYRMKYDEYGIMTSMIEISDPETEYCHYEIENDGKLGKEIMSIHPEIYNTFDITHVRPDFIESKEMALDTYSELGNTSLAVYEKSILVD